MKRKSVMLKAFSIMLGIGWIPSALAYSVRAWQGKSDKDLSNRANWSDSASLLEKELAVGFIPGGTYYMGADCAFARLLMNQQDAGTVEFALGEGRTLTLLGSDSSAAFRATVNGSHSVLKVTSGTVAQVFEPGVSQKNGAVYQLADAATVGFTNIYEGASTTLNAHFLHHAFGTNNWLVARNGAVVNADLRFGGGTSYGNGVMIDNATLNLASWTNN